MPLPVQQSSRQVALFDASLCQIISSSLRRSFQHDKEYHEKRIRNNVAVRKCRAKRKREMDQLMMEITALTNERAALEREYSMAQARFHELESLYTDFCQVLVQKEDETLATRIKSNNE